MELTFLSNCNIAHITWPIKTITDQSSGSVAWRSLAGAKTQCCSCSKMWVPVLDLSIKFTNVSLYQHVLWHNHTCITGDIKWYDFIVGEENVIFVLMQLYEEKNDDYKDFLTTLTYSQCFTANHIILIYSGVCPHWKGGGGIGHDQEVM